MKKVVWGLLTLIISTVITYKLTVMYFFLTAATNDTTAPLAALLTAIPVGLFIFQLAVFVVKHLVMGLRKTLIAIA